MLYYDCNYIKLFIFMENVEKMKKKHFIQPSSKQNKQKKNYLVAEIPWIM